MLRGIERNRIIVGAYADPRSGGICPMLAAHRNGGRTSLASFARAWDRYTGARRPRLATRREVRVLRTYLELSLLPGDQRSHSIAELADGIRAERNAIASRGATDKGTQSRAATDEGRPTEKRHRAPTGERHRGRELRSHPRWAGMRPARAYEDYKDLLAAAEEQLSEARAAELLGERPAELLR